MPREAVGGGVCVGGGWRGGGGGGEVALCVVLFVDLGGRNQQVLGLEET